jgi:biotin operon repressor
MTLQAEGNYAKAKEMTEKLGGVRPEIQKAIDRMKKIPVDIEPIFVTAQQLVRDNP